MPGFNRKGPEGEGPMTGRGMGKCQKSENAEQEFSELKRGRGRALRLRFRGESGGGRGRGTGRGRW